MISQIRSKRTEGGDQLTRQIIGCCFRVHRQLGPGFPEKIYQAALVEGMATATLSVERERRFQVSFDDAPVGDFYVDLLVDHRVIVEVKAVTGTMPRVFEAQLLAYLKAAQLPVGLLVNFGNVSCQVKRVSFSALSAKSMMKSAESNPA